MTEKFNVAEMTVAEVESVIAGFEQVSIEMMAVIEEWMPVVMSQFSESLYCARWLADLHEVLPKVAPSIRKAAGLLGQIPAWDDNALESKDGYQISWVPYKQDVS